MDVLNSVSKAARNIMLSQPFYGLFLSTLNKKLSEDVDTMGIGKSGINMELLVNPKHWESMPEDIRQGALTHELIHICLQHLNMVDKFADKQMFNVAADCEVNSHIDPKYRDNDHWCTVENLNKFYGLNLKPGMGTDTYYGELMKLSPQQQQQIKDDFGQGEGEGDNEQDSDGDGESNGKSKQGKGNKSGKPNSKGKLGDHKSWKKFEDMSETEKKLVHKQVQHQMKQVAEQMKNQGMIPGELKALLDKILNPEEPKFDWKAYMRRFAGGSNKVYTKKIRRKQSKRYEDNPGLKIKQRKHILIFNDSSGSVSDKDYQEFIQEIYHISKTGTEVTIADFDTQVQNVRKFDYKKDTQRSGYGGTDFNCCMKYYNENKHKYCSCIVFTDGYCSSPNIQPQNKILWAICSNGADSISLPGFKIKLN